MSSSRKPVIGVAGGIGSGKSTVARQFESLGAARFDADTEAKAALDRPSVRRHIADWWGDEVLDDQGQVNRTALAELIFEDPAARQRLEGLVHPVVEARCRRFIHDAERDDKVKAVVLDVPLIFEAGWQEQCDALVFVDAEPAVRLERVRADRGWDEAELTRREKFQWPLDNKRQFAHYIVENHASEGECLAQVRDVFSRVLESC